MSELEPEQTPEATPEPAEPSWTGPSEEEWSATQAQLAQIAQMLQPQQPQYQQPYQNEPPIPDPFAEDYQQQYLAREEWRMQGYQQLESEIRYAQADDWAHEHLDELAQRGGEFNRDRAFERANILLMQHGGDPVQALEQAAKDIREYEQQNGQAFYDRQIEQLQTNAGAPRGVPASGVSGAQTVTTGGLGAGPFAVTRKFFPQGNGG